MRTVNLVSRSLLVLAVGATCVVGLCPAAEAARRTSLAGNLLLEDADDVFPFPQLSTKYARSVSFDYGAEKGSGNGLLLMGDTYQAWGIALHRGDATDPQGLSIDHDLVRLGAPSGNVNDGTFPTPLTVVDFLYASANPGDGSGWGLRISLGNGSQSQDPNGDPKESGADQTYLALTAGYSAAGSDLAYDLAGSLVYSTGTQLANGKEVKSGTAIDLTVTGRGSMSLAGEKDTRLGLLGQLGVKDDTSSQTVDPKFDDVARSIFLLAGAGPVVKVAQRIQLAAYGFIGATINSADPNSEGDDDQTDIASYVLPGVNLATEVQLRDWLFFRTGGEYTFAIRTEDSGDNANARKASDRQGTFGWNAGIGLVFENITFDGALAHGFLTQGPDFIGGDSALFGMFSARAKF